MSDTSELIAQQILNSNITKRTWGDLLVNVKAYGAVGDGVTDDTIAIQNAVTAALDSHGKVVFPSGTYKVTSPIIVNGEGFIELCGSGEAILTTTMTGNIIAITSSYRVTIKDMNFEHNGIGSCVSINGEFHQVVGCFMNNKAGNTGTMIYYTGANTEIRDCQFTNYEPAAYTINCQSIPSVMNINTNILDNYFGGPGKGILINSASTGRPEGISINRNDFILTGTEQITVEAVLDVDISNNMLDQSSLYNVYINASSLGVEGVSIQNNYISTAQNTSAGIGVQISSSNSVKNVLVDSNRFAFCGNGVSGGANVDGISVKDNSFTSIANGKVNLSSAINKIVEDNIGHKTSGWSNQTFSAATTGTKYVLIPHGLTATPDLSKCLISVNQNGSSCEVSGMWVITADVTNVTVGVIVSFAATGSPKVNLYAEV